MIKSLLIIVGMIVEGNTTLFTASFLAHQKILGIWETLFLIITGAVIADTFWYMLGFLMNHSFVFIKRWIDKISPSFDQQIVNQPFRTILVTKFIYGIHNVILIRFGNLKMVLKKFVIMDFAAILIWIIVVGGLGYISGASFLLFKHYLRFAEIGLAIGLAIFIFLSHFLKIYTNKN